MKSIWISVAGRWLACRPTAVESLFSLTENGDRVCKVSEGDVTQTALRPPIGFSLDREELTLEKSRR